MIPRQVTTRTELLPGVGVREVVAVALGGAVGYLVFLVATAVLAVLSLPNMLAVFVRYTVPILMPALGFALVMNGEHSILNAQLRAIRHNRRPHRLLFRVGSARSTPTAAAGALSPVTAVLSALLGFLTGQSRRTPRSTGGLPKTVQQWLPVRDLPPGGLIERRDGHLVAAIRVEPRNIALLSVSERVRVLRAVRTALNAVGTPENQIVSVPRPIDLDGYLRRLDATLPDMTPARQHLLRQYIRYVADLVAGGEAQERRFYIMLARPGGKGAAEELRQQTADLAARLAQADLLAHVVNDRELLNLLFVFHHPTQAAVERPQAVPYLTTLAKEEG